MMSLIINGVLFWLRLVLFRCAISIALAYPMLGVCYAMNRERNGSHPKPAGAFLQRAGPGRWPVPPCGPPCAGLCGESRPYLRTGGGASPVFLADLNAPAVFGAASTPAQAPGHSYSPGCTAGLLQTHIGSYMHSDSAWCVGYLGWPFTLTV